MFGFFFNKKEAPIKKLDKNETLGRYHNKALGISLNTRLFFVLNSVDPTAEVTAMDGCQ